MASLNREELAVIVKLKATQQVWGKRQALISNFANIQHRGEGGCEERRTGATHQVCGAKDSLADIEWEGRQ